MVDGRHRGNGRRYYFRDLTDARVKADQLAIELKNHGVALLNFSTRDRAMFVEARELLADTGKTIRDAAEHLVFFLKARAKQTELPLIRDCAEQYVTSRQRELERNELSRRSFVEARQCARRLAAAMGDLSIGDLDAERVRSYIESHPVSALSRHDLRLRLSGFCSFCRRKGWLTTNPCADIKVKIPRHDVVILTVDEAERLLRCAEESKFRNTMVPFFAISLFGGLRSAETAALCWEQVDFETSHIHVLRQNSKTRVARFVPLSSNLVQWLLSYRLTSGRIIGPNLRKQSEAVRRAAGFNSDGKRWTPSICRHSYCSYALAFHENRHQVCEWAGHSLAIFSKHYRKPITKANAQRFWSLSPGTAPIGARDTTRAIEAA